jgi:raffinose/stachyose/melibiose transport system permease protein
MTHGISTTGSAPAIEEPVTTRPRRQRKPIDRGHVLSYALLLGLGAIYLGPFLMLLNTALKTQPAFAKDPIGPTSTFSIENFAEAWDKADFAQYMTNSVLYAGLATLLYLVAAVPLAVAISRRYVRGWNLLYILFVIALFLPVALIPQFQLILNLRLYNTQPGYILLFLANPIGVLILVAFVRSIPRELDEAVAIDGCGYIRYIWRIVVPLTTPAIATVAILHAIGIWNELVLPTIYLTNQAYYPMTRGLIAFTGIYGNDWPLLAAAVLILALPMVVLFLFLQRYIIGGFTAGSVRG